MNKTLMMTFEADFIQRTLRTTGILLLIAFLIGIYYFGFFPSLALLSAGIWSMINLMFLSALIRKVMRPENIDKMTVAVIALIKFPLLYVAGYFLLKVEFFEPLPLIIGFSSVILVMMLKAFSRAILKLDYNGEEGGSRGLA